MNIYQAGIYNTIIRCFRESDKKRRVFSLDEVSTKVLSEEFCSQEELNAALKFLVDSGRIRKKAGSLKLMAKDPEYVSVKLINLL